MMQDKRRVILLWQPKYQRIDDHKKMFGALINVVENNGEKFDETGLVLRQLATNGFVAGANGDVLGVANNGQIAAAKETISESMKVDISLESVNG